MSNIISPEGKTVSSIANGDIVRLNSGDSKWTVMRTNPQISDHYDLVREEQNGVVGMLQAVHPKALTKIA